MKNSLLVKIINAQKNHEEDLLGLVNDFVPLIKKYAIKMNSEDFFADLRLEFIEIILGIDTEKFSNYEEPQILSYIKTSVYNAYIKLSKKKCNYENNTFPVEDIRDEIEKSTQFGNKLDKGVDYDSFISSNYEYSSVLSKIFPKQTNKTFIIIILFQYIF